jgi:hypothetical protein
MEFQQMKEELNAATHLDSFFEIVHMHNVMIHESV